MPSAARGREAHGGGGTVLVVIDSGGGYIRAGLATEARPRAAEPNCIATVAAKGRAAAAASAQGGATPSGGTSGAVFGSEALEQPAYILHRPTQRGAILDLEQQKSIWDFVLRQRLGVDPRSCSVLVSETPFCPGFMRREAQGVFLEAFGCKEVCFMSAPLMALHSPGICKELDQENPCCTVVNVGFSGCLAMPCLEKQAIKKATRRLNVGGRVLTNLLLERLRLRHYDLSESWLLAEDMLSRMGEVSPDFDVDLHTDFARVRPRSYVLPDFETRRRGVVEQDAGSGTAAVAASKAEGGGGKDDAVQRVTLGAERVAVPEALFSPGDHGILHQAGLADLVRQAIFAVSEDEAYRMHFGQVVLCGALARLPGLKERLWRDLRQMLPSHWPVRVLQEDEPELSVWRGAAELAKDPKFRAKSYISHKVWEQQAVPGGPLAKRRKVVGADQSSG